MKLFDQPQKNYNLNEKIYGLIFHHQQSVIAKKGQKQVYLVSPEYGENVTVVACTNAAGRKIPPMIIFKGKTRRENFGDILPPLACFEMAEKGSMTYEIFVSDFNILRSSNFQAKFFLFLMGRSVFRFRALQMKQTSTKSPYFIHHQT